MSSAHNKHNSTTAQSSLQLLRKIAPPKTIIHIGAGAGTGAMHQWRQWDVANAFIIDADADRLHWANALIEQYPGWRVFNAVLAEADGEIEFHHASNPDEDGLISPEHLNIFWPNLHTTAQELRIACRLDHLLAEAEMVNPAPPVWAFIDCLPALPILKGAGTLLQRYSVLWLRTVLQPIAHINDEARLEVIEAFLQSLGFRCIEIAEGNHPTIGHALFVRDWQSVLQAQIDTLSKANAAMNREREPLLLEKSSLSMRQDELQRETQALAQARDEQARLAGERQQQIEATTRAKAMLEQEKSALSARQDELQKEAEVLIRARDAQAKLAAERQTQIGQLTQVRDEQVRLAGERQQQIEALTQVKAILEQEKSALSTEVEVLIRARDAQAKLAAERQIQIGQLTQVRDEQARLAGERQQQIEALTQAKAILEQENSVLSARREELKVEIQTLTEVKDEQARLAAERQTKLDAISMERDEQTKLLAQRNTEFDELQVQVKQKDDRIGQIESDLAEYDARQRLLNDEMTRAEAQIDLIKDVLLREPGL